MYLSDVCGAMNEGFNLTLKERPYFLMFARDPNNPFNILKQGRAGEDKNEAYMMALYSYDLVEKELGREYAKRDERQITAGRLTHYEIGDIVYLQRHFVSDKGYKIKYPYIGPFRVVDTKGSVVTLLNLSTGKVRQASMRHIKLFKAESLSKTQNPNVSRVFPMGEKAEVGEDINLMGEDPPPLEEEGRPTSSRSDVETTSGEAARVLESPQRSADITPGTAGADDRVNMPDPAPIDNTETIKASKESSKLKTKYNLRLRR